MNFKWLFPIPNISRKKKCVQGIVDTMTELGQDDRKLIPASIVITSVAVIVLNFLFIWLNHTLIFDPLFYVPIILTAHDLPRRGVFFTVGTAMLYLAMGLAEFYQSMDIVVTGLGTRVFSLSSAVR